MKGRTGQFCQDLTTDPCARRPCYNGGTCVRVGTTQTTTCICGANFSGTQCQNNKLGACAKNPCSLRNGVCVPVGLTDYKCQCPDLTVGKNCETVFNPCGNVKCLNSGICLKSRTTAYQCNCTKQWTGAVCEKANVITIPTNNSTRPASSVTTSTSTTPATTTPATNSSNYFNRFSFLKIVN